MRAPRYIPPNVTFNWNAADSLSHQIPRTESAARNRPQCILHVRYIALHVRYIANGTHRPGWCSANRLAPSSLNRCRLRLRRERSDRLFTTGCSQARGQYENDGADLTTVGTATAIDCTAIGARGMTGLGGSRDGVAVTRLGKAPTRKRGNRPSLAASAARFRLGTGR